MSLLLQATLRGSLLFGLVFGFDRLFGRSMRAPSRRWWWGLIAAAFLIPVHFSVTVPAIVPHFGWVSSHPSGVGLSAGMDEGASHQAIPFAGNTGSCLVLVWLSGVLIYLAALGGRTIRVTRRWSHERLSTDSPLLELLEDCKQQMGITAPIGLVVSPDVSGPALLGCVRPRILLPTALVAAMSRSQLRAVLIHELAHFRSGDMPLNWLFSLTCAVHWFNPAAHLTFAAWRQFQEEAADESAIRWTDDPSGKAYGETLFQALAQSNGEAIPFGALSLGEPINKLKRRFQMINLYARKTSRQPLAFAVALLLIAAIAVLPVRAAGDGSKDDLMTIAASMTSWMHEVDAGNGAQSWKEASAAFQQHVTQEAWTAKVAEVNEQMGKNTGRKLISIKGPHDTDGKPMVAGDIVVAKFASSFEHMADLSEKVMFRKGPDGAWRVAGYLILPQ